VRSLAELHFVAGGHLLSQADRLQKETAYQPSRPYLEHQVRARVTALPNVRVLERCEATGLTASGTPSRVTGARIVRLTDGGSGEELLADLVIDATGRGSRTMRWLSGLGYPEPAEERVPVDVKYVTRQLRLAPGALGARRIFLIGAIPERPTALAMFPQEGDRHLLTLGGYRGHHPSPEPARFLEFVRTIAPPRVFAAIRDAEALNDPVTNRYASSLRRRYDRLRRFPAGLVVIGDAICSFNPLYGQGMTITALEATALRDCLPTGEADLARRFFRATAGLIELAWRMGYGNDIAVTASDGPPPPRPIRITNALADRLLAATTVDAVVAERFLELSGFLAPPTALLRPAMLTRVLAANVRLARRGHRLQPPAEESPLPC